MFSIKLNAPVLLRKQLPVIAKALHVDEKVLDDFLSVSAFYGVKDGKGTIVPIKKTDTIVHIDYKAYDNYYFVVDAILQYAKDIDTSVTLPVITEIELGTDVFKKFSPDQLSDIMFLTRRLKDSNERVTKLAELNAPDILLANERALLCKKVEFLEDNEHTPKPDRNIDGHVCASLHDIGYSILDGWLNKKDSVFESDGKNNSGYDPDKLAALVKKAIGTRTQEQFSQTSHLGRVYVNRLANGKTQSQPTEVTLKKIAKATDAVTENELRQACGYEPLPGEDVVESKKRIENVDEYLCISTVQPLWVFSGECTSIARLLSNIISNRHEYCKLLVMQACFEKKQLYLSPRFMVSFFQRIKILNRRKGKHGGKNSASRGSGTVIEMR